MNTNKVSRSGEQAEAIAQTLAWKRGWRSNPGQGLAEMVSKSMAARDKREGQHGEQQEKVKAAGSRL